jgi:hypothetical protein
MQLAELSFAIQKNILEPAEAFNHDLTLQLELIALQSGNEKAFIENLKVQLDEWLEEEDLMDVMEEIFFDEMPDEEAFEDLLIKLEEELLK